MQNDVVSEGNFFLKEIILYEWLKLFEVKTSTA